MRGPRRSALSRFTARESADSEDRRYMLTRVRTLRRVGWHSHAESARNVGDFRGINEGVPAMSVRPLRANQQCRCAPVPGTDIPISLLTEFISDDKLDPPLHALTVDYERGNWRAGALAQHLLRWTIDYALRPKERANVPAALLYDAAATAIRRTFGTGSASGVPGELLLHIACRQVFHSDTVISKVVFKSSKNETFRGFDGVHVVHGDEGLELWLGEAKFYRNLTSAIRSVIHELEDHLATDYLRDEFALVTDKIDDDHPHAAELRRLLDPSVSLDQVVRRICVPVLLTYDSDVTLSNTVDCAAYRAELEAELKRGWTRFKNALDGLPDVDVAIRLILVPLATKQALVASLRDLRPRRTA
jgi:hypothetical protein